MHHDPNPVPHVLGESYAAHLVYGLGSLWGAVNIATWGANAFSLIGPVALGLAALWQAKTSHDRLVFEREKFRSGAATDRDARQDVRSHEQDERGHRQVLREACLDARESSGPAPAPPVEVSP